MKRVAWLAIVWLTGAQAASITGMVVDQFDEPVAGATVAAYDDAAPAVTTQADEGGRFTLELDRREGLWRVLSVVAFRPNRGVASWLVFDSLERLEQPVRLRLGPVSTLAGTVAGDDGKPVAGARVAAVLVPNAGTRWRQSGEDPELVVAECRSDAAGRWSCSGVPVSMRLEVRCSAAGMSPDVLLVEESERPRDLTFTLAATLQVRGRAVDPSGRPVAGVRATLKLGEGWFGDATERTTLTDDQGRFRFDDVPREPMTVFVGPDVHGRVAWSQMPFWPPTKAYWDLANYRLKPGIDHWDCPDAVLRPGGRLRLTVVGADGQPLSGVWFTTGSVEKAARDGQRHTVSGRTEEAGRVEAVLPAGEHECQFGHPDYQGVQRQFTVKPGHPVEQRIVMPFREASSRSEVSGQVVDEAGQPVPGAVVSFYLWAVTCDYTGHFAMRRSDGCWLDDRTPVVASAPGYSTFGSSLHDLPRNQPWQLKLQRLPVREVRGRVVDEQRQPVAEARIRLHEELQSPLEGLVWDRVPWLTHSDADGRFRFTKAAAVGRLGLVASMEGYSAGPPAWLDAAAAPGETVELRLRWTSGKARGTVLDEAGQPVAGATVYAEGQCPETPLTTGVDGRFAVVDLPAGRVPIVALVGQSGFGRVAVRIEREGPATVELTTGGAPPVQLTPGTPEAREQARQLLLRAWREATATPPEVTIETVIPALWATTLAAYNLARFDSALAFEQAQSLSGTRLQDIALYAIFTALSQEAPEQAWAVRDRLDQINDVGLRVESAAVLGLALAETHRDWAEQMYAPMRDGALALAGSPTEVEAYGARAALALRLGKPEGEAWLAELLRESTPERSDALAAMHRFGGVAEQVLRAEMAAWVGWPRGATVESQRGKFELDRWLDNVFTLTETDPLAALRLLQVLCGRSGPIAGRELWTPGFAPHYGEDFADLVAGIADHDVAAAGILARRLTPKDIQAQALIRVAARIDQPDRAMRLIREAKELGGRLAPLARVAARYEPETAAFWASRAFDFHPQPGEAFDLAGLEPNRARLLAEQGLNGDQARQAALAFLPLDLGRVLDLAESGDDLVTRTTLLCAAARWLSLDEAHARRLVSADVMRMVEADQPTLDAPR